MIPANITSELSALQAQTAAAAPLASAPHATVVAIQLNAAQLASDINTAVTTLAGALDTYTWTPGDDPSAIAAAVDGLLINALYENAIVNMQGYVGRSVINLNQLP
jgi:hypothetical protein